MRFSSRRQFLKEGLSVSFFSILSTPCRAIFDLEISKQALPAWKELIDYARWCPSVHNLQPYKVKIISATDADLYYDPARLLPVADPGSIFMTVSMGVFIEHLSIAAASSGYEVIVTEIFNPLSNSARIPAKFAGLRLIPAENKEYLDRELIKKRRTSRLHYNGEPLSEKSLRALKEEAIGQGHEVFWSSEKQMVEEVIRLNQQTLFEDLGSGATRDELNRLFRYTDQEAEIKKDGLWARCMCFPGKLMRSVFNDHERWEHGLKKTALAGYYKNSFKGTHTICWFGGNFDNTTDWLNAGKTLARCWLLLTKEGACIHPFGSLITNKAAYEKINALFTQPAKGKIWMIFRAGYSREPARSYRLDTEEIIIN
jgi:hypothetical protein